MTQAQLNRAVARATGESISTVARMGFSCLKDDPHDRPPLVMDWDELDAERAGLFPSHSGEPRANA